MSAEPALKTLVREAKTLQGWSLPRNVRLSIATMVVLLFVWWAVTALKWIPPLFLPAPQQVLHQLVTIASPQGFMDATLWQHLEASLARIVVALFAAVVIGVPVGIAMGLNETLRGILDPLIELYRPVPPLAGDIGLAKGVKLGYFAQHQLEFLRAEDSPLQHLVRLADKQTEQQLRDYLGGFGFQGDKVTEETRRFSGGEKARLVLALIVWQRPNLLLLDEPTNHLDLDMRQALTEALIDFEGAMVVVSHDRHLLRSTTDDLYLVHGGKVEQFDGDLDDYQQWLVDIQRQESQQDAPDKDAGANSAQSRKDQKRREADFRNQTQPLRKQITTLEKQMEKLSSELASVEEKLADSAIYDSSRKADLTACLQQQIKVKGALEEVEMTWLDAQEQLEQLAQEFNAGA